MKEPHIIDFGRIGESKIGFISVAEAKKQVRFQVKRVFWTYFTPEDIQRGSHAHFETEQILIAVAGIIQVETEMPNGQITQFELSKPNIGLYVPPNSWHVMKYSHNAVQMVFASTHYSEDDYIRDYETFKKHYS